MSLHLIFYSSEAYLTRISVPFARGLKRRPQPSASGSLVLLSQAVTAATSTGVFTAVVDALVDPLCDSDVVSQLELPPASVEINVSELLNNPI